MPKVPKKKKKASGPTQSEADRAAKGGRLIRMWLSPRAARALKRGLETIEREEEDPRSHTLTRTVEKALERTYGT